MTDVKDINQVEDMPEVDDQETVVVITDEDGNESYFLEEMVVPVGEKNFAILVGVPENEEEEIDEEDENVIVARIEFDKDGEPTYLDPTEEEFAAFQAAYEKMMDEEDGE